ncbi:N-formylglutamate amidohydrolase [Acidisphaera sp. L21]|uniref:N-formylglutamate amidohydrolase n=1 Tax=Acidisphaera sp. L21 TaxID=1641851 RepID=UPI00131EC1B7|nr:N-formylglutamate amidohydrolase [Acidisphaera sp. L21]
MDLATPAPDPTLESPAPYIILRPPVQLAPLVVASPHSGRYYAPEFLSAARLGPLDLRRSEDSFVEELFQSAVTHGAPLLCAQFPRAFCDPNREAWELDPTMFADALPPWVNTTSPRVGAGLGTIARVVTSGESIYRGKLQFADAQARVATCWQPYHDALAGLIADTQLEFDCCLLIDCHSMPVGSGRFGGPDFVLGDAHGTACMPQITALVERVLREFGYEVRRNDPYAGGYVTRHYGRPRYGVHALQIEVARRLYMDESVLERSGGFNPLRAQLDILMQHVAAACAGIMAPAKKEGGASRHRQV